MTLTQEKALHESAEQWARMTHFEIGQKSMKDKVLRILFEHQGDDKTISELYRKVSNL